MVKGSRPPNSKRRKETAYSFFGLYLSNRYATLLRGARDELVEDNLFPIYFPPLVESNCSISFGPISLCRNRSRGQSSSGLYSGRGSEAASFQLCPGVPPRAVPGQAGAAAGAAPDRTPGRAMKLACFDTSVMYL
jgi:hypothetical protein